MHRRHGKTMIICEHSLHPPDVVGLLTEVELTLQRRGEMLEHGLHVDHLIERGTLSHLFGKHFEQGEILFDLGASRRALNLDDDPIIAFECRTVDLSDCASGEGIRVDRLEHILPRYSQFLLRDPDNLALGHWRHVALQQGQFFNVLDWKEIRSGRQHLSEFRECRTQLFQGRA